MIMLIIPNTALTTLAIENTSIIILIIVTTTATIQAHLFPFSSPYATMNDATAIEINTPPIAVAILPKNEGGTNEGGIPEIVMFPLLSVIVRFPFLKASSKVEGGSEEINAPAIIARIPPTSTTTPLMITRIAIIVTPSGRDLGVLCKICCNNMLFRFLIHKVKNFA